MVTHEAYLSALEMHHYKAVYKFTLLYLLYFTNPSSSFQKLRILYRIILFVEHRKYHVVDSSGNSLHVVSRGQWSAGLLQNAGATDDQHLS